MPALFDYEHIVGPSEIDGWGHVNNLAYLKWMQDAAIAHSAAQGWPTDRYFELGAGWVVRSHQIEYLRPAFVAEHLLVRTWVADFRRISSLRKYKIVRQNDQLVLAVAQTQWAFIGFQDHAPRRIPAEVCSSFELLPEDEEP
jgi:acyl-CoA thioester hydrolase